jgi:hypothetical protein
MENNEHGIIRAGNGIDTEPAIHEHKSHAVEDGFDYIEEAAPGRRDPPWIDWHINMSHILTILGSLLIAMTAYFNLSHQVDLDRQESRTSIELLRARVISLEEKANLRTQERQDADNDIRQTLRELKMEMSEQRRILATHMNVDDQRFRNR